MSKPKLGGRGVCPLCDQTHNNVSFHTAHECSKRKHPTKAKMTKLFREADLEGGLRTDVVEGVIRRHPEVGDPFVLESAPLDEKYDTRIVSTSRVTSIEEVDGAVLLRTESNSLYKVEYID